MSNVSTRTPWFGISGWLASPLFRWSLGILTAVAIGLGVFRFFQIPLLSPVGMPHEYCYLQEPKLIWLNVSSDLVIGFAYVSISATLATLVYKTSKGIPFNGVFLAFGLFIVSCGLTHFMEVWVVWKPLYWLAGYIKVFTALASAATALALFPLLPKVFALIEAARKGEQRRLEIEQLNQELERFNYSVAHDLRTPLRGIVGLGSALREDFGEQIPPRATEYILRMETSASRMNALITDLLRYATVGRQEIVRLPVPLDEIIQRAKSLLETEIKASHAEIICPARMPNIQGDPTLLLVIFQNLLGNALKFVKPNIQPRIEFRVENFQGVAKIFVIDNGIGIPAQQRDQVFRMFERVHPEYPGTGIGLAIVNRAVERLHGKIEVMDSPNGQGTCFCVALPISGRQ